MVVQSRVVAGAAAAVLVMVACSCQVVAVSVSNEEWEGFKTLYNKTYPSGSNEDMIRRRLYQHTKLLVSLHNHRHAANLSSFRLAVNHLADLMPREITGLFTAPHHHNHHQPVNNNSLETIGGSAAYGNGAGIEAALPSTVDWRQKGAVTGVKSQLQCASGWAFATTGAVEGQIFRRRGRLISMSEQNLIDCCHLCHGCQGGRMDYAFTYIMQTGGLDTEASYPYEARDNVCRYRPSGSVTRVQGYSTIPAGDENALKTAVATFGPVAVAIDASLPTFHYYTHGVYYDPHCSATQLTHGALVVGYGTQGGRDYWLVKNSWGTYWGDRGYIKMARNLNNNCGIATAASYPFL